MPMLALLEAMAGAPLSPARISPPRALLFLRRWRGQSPALCSWSEAVFKRGNGSDMVNSGRNAKFCSVLW